MPAARALSLSLSLFVADAQSVRPGHEHVITSDGFFELEDLPKSALVFGGGYIAVELAGVLNTLGSKVTLCVRSKMLRTFDVRAACFTALCNHSRRLLPPNCCAPDSCNCVPNAPAHTIVPQPALSEGLKAEYLKHGITILEGNTDKSVEKRDDGLYATLADGSVLGPFEAILCAKGRRPSTSAVSGYCPHTSAHSTHILSTFHDAPATAGLGLDKVGVALTKRGHIQVDEFSNTTAKNIYAVGDVIGSGFDLTPAAIAAGMCRA